MNADKPAALPFPARGLDLSRGLSRQLAGSTPLGRNVRLVEPHALRARGGSRPGLSKFVAGQVPEGSELIQHLNIVVLATGLALPTGIEDPGTILVDDPSSAGPPYSWGTGTLYFDPLTGDPVTGADLGTRVPGSGGPGTKPKRRKGGSGVQPSKNTLTLAPGTISPGICFQGRITVTVTKPDPDPLHWTGQNPSFVGHGCMNNGIVPVGGGLFKPTTALIVPRGVDDSIGSKRMPLLTYIKFWLSLTVGGDSYGTVTVDLVSQASSATCSLREDCAAGTPTESPTLPSIGYVIHAA